MTAATACAVVSTQLAAHLSLMLWFGGCMLEARKHCPWAMWFVRVLSPMKRAGATELIITKAKAEIDETGKAVVSAGVRLILK